MQDMLHYIEAEPKIYADILANRQTILRALLNDKSTAYKKCCDFCNWIEFKCGVCGTALYEPAIGHSCFCRGAIFYGELYVAPATGYVIYRHFSGWA